jgi:hypothetical protein
MIRLIISSPCSHSHWSLSTKPIMGRFRSSRQCPVLAWIRVAARSNVDALLVGKTRSHLVCTPSPGVFPDQNDTSDSSDSDLKTASRSPKRNYSQVASSPPQPRVRGAVSLEQAGRHQRKHETSPFCNQKCILDLKQGWPPDNARPNVSNHRRGQKWTNTW